MITMIDLWSQSEETKKEPSSNLEDDPLFRALVHHTLERELLRRRELRAHAQLGVRLDADAKAVDTAYQGMRARYDPKSYQRYGAATVAIAQRIVALLDQSRAHMQQAKPPAPPSPSGFMARMMRAIKKTP